MTLPIDSPTWIRIEAPDGDSALALEQRLAHLHASAVAHRDRWSVNVEDFDDHLDEIEAVVRHWLRTIEETAARIQVGGVTRVVTVHVPDEARLGAGYDREPALEHEP